MSDFKSVEGDNNTCKGCVLEGLFTTLRGCVAFEENHRLDDCAMNNLIHIKVNKTVDK